MIFNNCWSVVYGYIGRNLFEGEVVWEYFLVLDNYDIEINVIWIGLIFLNDKIKVGIYIIIYNVEDLIGNWVILCIIKIVMKGKVKYWGDEFKYLYLYCV